MQNLAFQAAAMRDAGVLRSAVEDATFAMVDTRDIADVAAATLTVGSPIEGQEASLTGPDALSYDTVAEAASSAFGRAVRYERQSTDKVRAPSRDLASQAGTSTSSCSSTRRFARAGAKRRATLWHECSAGLPVPSMPIWRNSLQATVSAGPIPSRVDRSPRPRRDGGPESRHRAQPSVDGRNCIVVSS